MRATQRTEDTIIAALLAGFWVGIMMGKLEGFTVGFPVLHAMAQWWPVLLIVGGIAWLVKHQLASPTRQASPRLVRVPAQVREANAS